MKLLKAIAILTILCSATNSYADIMMIKKSKKDTSKTEQYRNRHEDDIARFNKTSADLADRMLNPEKYANEKSKTDNFQVTMITKK